MNSGERERTADQRSTILAAAISILRAEGAGALTVRSVASAAGCSTTGVYTWFGGKNGLVEAIFVDGFDGFGAALARVPAGPLGRPSLARLASAYRKWALANPTHYMVMFAKAVPDFHPSGDALVRALTTFEVLVDATRTTMDHLGTPGSADEIAHHLWASMHGYVSLELAGMDIARSTAQRTRRFTSGMRTLERVWLQPG